jgi:hypothetical protein
MSRGELGEMLGHGEPTATDMRIWAQARLDPKVSTATGDRVRIPSRQTSKYSWGTRKETFNCGNCPHNVPKAEAEKVQGWISSKAQVSTHEGICLFGQNSKGEIIPKSIEPVKQDSRRSCNTSMDQIEQRTKERSVNGTYAPVQSSEA